MNVVYIGLLTIRYTDRIAIIFYSSRSYVTVRADSKRAIDLAIEVLLGRRDVDSPYMNNTIYTIESYKNSLENTQPIPIVVAS